MAKVREQRGCTEVVPPLEQLCPLHSSGVSPVKCDGRDCAWYVVRTNGFGHVSYQGCAVKWLGSAPNLVG